MALLGTSFGGALAQRGPDTDAAWEIIRRSHEFHVRGGEGAIRGQLASNARDSHDLLLRRLDAGRLTLTDVLALNGHLRTSGLEGGHVRDPGGGRLRRQDVAWYENGRRVHQFPSWKTVEAQARMLEILLADVSSRPLTRSEAVHAAAWAHEHIVHHQLFSDGNHRTARAVADWILMRHAMPPADYASVSHSEYTGDIKANFEERVPRFERALERAVAASERRVAAAGVRMPVRGPRLADPARTIALSEIVAEGHAGSGSQGTGSLDAAGTRPRIGSQTGFVRLGVLTGLGTAALLTTGMAAGEELVREVAAGQTVQGARIARAAIAPAVLAGALGFVVAEGAAQALLSSLVPVPGVGALVSRPLVRLMVAGTVGMAAAGTLVDVVGGGAPLDVVDLVGSSVSSGVGMALGSLLLPGVGSIVGAIAGGLAWQVGASLFRRARHPPSAATTLARRPLDPIRGRAPEAGGGAAAGAQDSRARTSGVASTRPRVVPFVKRGSLGSTGPGTSDAQGPSFERLQDTPVGPGAGR